MVKLRLLRMLKMRPCVSINMQWPSLFASVQVMALVDLAGVRLRA